MKKYAVYARKDIKQLKSFLVDYLGFDWTDKAPPKTPYSRIIFLSGLRITWVHSDKLPEQFTLLEYKTDRTKLLYVLKKMYGDKLHIPHNTQIHLSDERIELIKKVLQYYKDTYDWQSSTKVNKLERIIDDEYYAYKDKDMLNELVDEYRDSQKDLSGTVGTQSKKLDLDINKLVDKAKNGTMDPTDDTFKKLLDELRQQREKDKVEKRKSDLLTGNEPPQKYWDDRMDKWNEFHDRTKKSSVDTDKTSDDQKPLDNNKISSDQIQDSGWLDMTKDFISDMWKGKLGSE